MRTPSSTYRTNCSSKWNRSFTPTFWLVMVQGRQKGKWDPTRDKWSGMSTRPNAWSFDIFPDILQQYRGKSWITLCSLHPTAWKLPDIPVPVVLLCQHLEAYSYPWGVKITSSHPLSLWAHPPSRKRRPCQLPLTRK